MTRVALVTGAARGIGAATVRALAAEGWAVVATDRCADDPRLPYALGTREELDRCVAEACALGGAGAAAFGGAGAAVLGGAGAFDGLQVVAYVADTCDAAALGAAVALAEQRFGGLDAVLAVAGVVAGGVPLWEQPQQQVDAVLEIDLGGVVTAARVGIPALLRRPAPRSGRFLAVASAAATRGLPQLAAYCAAKAGVTGLVRGLAAELAGTGVTANAVSPGSTDTRVLDESARLYALESAHDFASQQPLGRLVDPAEVAAALVWLAGPGSSAVTGATLAVDGGLSL